MAKQVGPGDDYMLTVGGFKDDLSTLGDSLISTDRKKNLNGMKFSTRYYKGSIQSIKSGESLNGKSGSKEDCTFTTLKNF